MKNILIFLFLVSFYYTWSALYTQPTPSDQIVYPWNTALTQIRGWYIDFWPTLQAIKKYQNTTLIGSDLVENPAYQSKKIPFFWEIFSSPLSKIWMQKFQKLLNNGKISIFGGENIDMFSPQKEKQTNTLKTEIYFVQSDLDQDISLKIYPVNNQEFTYFSHENDETWVFPVLTFFDPSLEYFAIEGKFTHHDDTNIYHPQDTLLFVKKYQIVKFDPKTYKLSISRSYTQKLPNPIITVFPYYEAKIHIKKWKNTFFFQYKTYTPWAENLEKSIVIQ